MKNKPLICIALTAALLLASCSTPGDPSDTTLPDSSSAESSAAVENPVDPSIVNIILNSASEYSIIRADGADEYTVRAGVLLRNAITERTGVTLELHDDWIRPDDTVTATKPEIIVGSCDRAELTEIKDTIGTRSFIIKVSGNKLIICGQTEKLTLTAVEYFIENYLTDEYSAEGRLTLPVDLDVTQAVTTFDMTQLINSEDQYTTVQDRVIVIEAEDGHKIMQGGCTDGRYLYMALVKDGTYSYIYKYDLEDYSLVLRSESLPLDHCNDICYNSDTGKLIVAHNAPNRNKISILDPETLTVEDTVKLPCTIFSISYCSERQQYAVGLSGGQNFALLNANFNVVKSFTVQSTGYTTQGMECDEDFIYFVQYDQNVIMIYDWSGKLINRVDLNLSGIEPENISLVGDTFYIGCNNWKGGYVYELSILKK